MLWKRDPNPWRNDPPTENGRYVLALYGGYVGQARYQDGDWILPNGIKANLLAACWKRFDEAPDDVHS